MDIHVISVSMHDLNNHIIKTTRAIKLSWVDRKIGLHPPPPSTDTQPPDMSDGHLLTIKQRNNTVKFLFITLLRLLRYKGLVNANRFPRKLRNLQVKFPFSTTQCQVHL